MVLLPIHSPCEALQLLAPLLRDDAETLPQRQVSPHLRPAIEQALATVEARLQPISKEYLRQILARFFLHYGKDIRPHEFAYYQHALQRYPEDLVCAGYQYLLRHHFSPKAPLADDFVAFIQPEFLHREALQRKLAWLAEKSCAEVFA